MRLAVPSHECSPLKQPSSAQQAATAGNHAPIVTANMLSLIKGVKPIKEHKVPGGPMILVTMGSQGIPETPLSNTSA